MRKKLFTLMTLLLTAVTGVWAQTTLFDAADANWSTYDKYASENVTYGSVTWHFGGSAAYAAGTSTIEGKTWNGRVKLGGSSTFKSGSTLSRVFTFTPASAGVVKVYCVHGSDKGTRTTYISQSISSTNRDTETALGSYAATPEAKNGVATATVEADKMVYVWADNNVGIYGITFTPSATYKVTYKANGSGEADIVDSEASTVAANTFTYAGHAFTGWNTVSDGSGTDYAVGATVTSDLTLFAQWATSYGITKGTHTNGDFTITPTSAAAGTEITLTATPSDGYDFVSWTILKTDDSSDITSSVSLSSATASTATFTMPAYDVTVNATFELSRYTVTYDVNGGGSCATASEKQATAGASLTLPTPTWAGYTFDGWYNDGTNIGDGGATYTPTANITLYAKWTDNTEGKLFSYVDGNYGDKFQAFDDSGWVTDAETSKSKTFEDAQGTQFIITNGAWDKKSNAISALSKFANGTTTMSIVIPTGYQATVKISYGAYNTSRKLTVDGDDQTAASTALNDSHTNTQIASDLKEITLEKQTGTLTLGSSDGNIYIGRVAVELTELVSITTTKAKVSYSSAKALNFEDSDLTAYIITGLTNTSATMEAVTDVPANTGLILFGTAGTTYEIPVGSATSLSSTNKLYASVTATAVEAKSTLVLSDGTFKTFTGTEIPANKAYLLKSDLPAGANELTLDIDGNGEDVTTGIENVEAQQNILEGDFYNLAGQRVSQPTKGLYIVNGKKVIVK